ncbi:MAG TPA: hypothetical protein VFA54_17740 [Bryobacterales bacterium]|nr:hypothetical protein [Bryobacterales bacterium]
MDRRTFLFSVPAAGALKPAAAAPAGAAVSIALAGSRHARVHVAVRELEQQLRAAGYAVDLAEGGPRIAGHRQIRLAVHKNRVAEAFEISSAADGISILAGGDRGLVYGISELSRQVAAQGRLPVGISLSRAPRFAVRRWSSSVSHLMGAPWDERTMLLERFAFIRSEILPRAGAYGMNSVEINGRPGDGWDVAWMIAFEKYPELSRLYPEGERNRRMAMVEEVGRAAHENLLDLLVWSHELYLPPGFAELYPQVRGTEYPVCLSHEFLGRFIRDKYIEFFERVPSVDGIVLSVNESGQFSLITDAGCKCDRCAPMSQHEKLMAVLQHVIAVCERLKKQLVLRTFQSSFIHDLDGHPELETIRKAYTGLPASVYIMSKYCPLDFYGGEIADEPLIGVFPNPHLVEFSLDVEWQGRTFVPVLTPGNFRRRIRHALDRKCAGIVARVDFPFPSMEPGPIFGHPNEFNAVFMGELLWADSDPSESAVRWASARYGREGAQQIAAALLSTEEITQKTFFAQGQTLINYHNMIASVSNADSNLWSHALSKWDSSKRELSRSFFEPADELIERCREEKRRAASLAQESLRVVERANSLTPPDRERLRSDFEKLRDTALLWGFLSELYLLARQAGSQFARLRGTAASALLTAVRMEGRYGRNSWPVVSPDRGVTAYEFVQQILRKYIGGFTGEPVRDEVKTHYGDSMVTVPIVRPAATEVLWRRLVECCRPGFAYGSTAAVRLDWPEKLADIRTQEQDLIFRSRTGQELRIPLPLPVQAALFQEAPKLIFRVVRTTRELVVTAERL